jgi:hypothetical protein
MHRRAIRGRRLEVLFDNPGGPAHGGALCLSNAVASLVNLTIAANQVEGGDSSLFSGYFGPAQGGSLWATNSSVTLRNTILADSTGGGEVWGTVTDGGYNLCSDGTAAFSSPGSLNGTDPLLSALDSNGGPTLTIALLPGSPARDAIASGFPLTDQRGLARPQGPAADMGAFEAAPLGPPDLAIGLSGANLTISFQAEAGGYVLLSSTDLQVWLPVATNSVVVPGPTRFIQPMTAAPRTFFQVVTREP